MIAIAFFRAGFDGNQDRQIHDWPMPPSHRKYPVFAKSSGTKSAFISAVDTVNGLRLAPEKFIQPRMYMSQFYDGYPRAPADSGRSSDLTEKKTGRDPSSTNQDREGPEDLPIHKTKE
jgi:hypothetical protein